MVLADGTRLGFRPLRAGDRDDLAAFFYRLTPESRRRRFLGAKRELTPKELRYFTDIDHVCHEAVAAIDRSDDTIVGVGRYAHADGQPAAAHIAVAVADDHHGEGIGTLLAQSTVQRARANGFRRLIATTLWENAPARALARRAGFRPTTTHGHEIEHELHLDADAD
jgi:RimJ/RimL family protein N-acetyltransferase